jgi:Transposase DDE domain
MENRSGLIVGSRLTEAGGRAERETALALVEAVPGRHRITVGADKGYDAAALVGGLRRLKATPHIAQCITGRRGSNLDGRTTRHSGYGLSQRARKPIEEAFGWMKPSRARPRPSCAAPTGSAGASRSPLPPTT